MGSESVEEYLEAIHSFNEKGEPAKTSAIAEKLGVAPPSVTQMIKTLSEDGLIEYTPYKGAILTGKGMAYAQKVVRKHRLLERFLYDFLKLSKNKVHAEACKLEHSLSDEAAAALCEALRKPEKCPDDEKSIPPCIFNVDGCDQCALEREEGSPSLVTQLSNLRPGEEGVIAFIRGGKASCQRLLDMGLTRGTSIRVENAAPFQGPIEVSLRGSKLVIGRGLAAHVFVEVKDNQSLYKRVHPHGPHHGLEH
ncbi:metal-dependent transcriptional regulator [Candidatus Bathyarchaeota archaeon]|nr:metal-dependent transcriptional regulator [Candidatus Bathyarchaeota archaeon]